MKSLAPQKSFLYCSKAFFMDKHQTSRNISATVKADFYGLGSLSFDPPSVLLPQKVAIVAMDIALNLVVSFVLLCSFPFANTWLVKNTGYPPKTLYGLKTDLKTHICFLPRWDHIPGLASFETKPLTSTAASGSK